MARAEEFESALWRDVIDVWFPRCLDQEHGGFLCDFDRAWNECGPHQKLLEFQARQTMLAAMACRAYPNDQRLRDATLHGFRYMRDVMWDREMGGWFHLLNRAGDPLEARTKHVHGFAYAIQACAEAHVATGEPDALTLAQEGLAWMDQHAHDRDNGGYFGFLTREGMAIRRPSDCPWKTELDTISTEIGLKDLNVHSDLLETFAVLYRVWPDTTVGERLSEILDIVSEKMVAPSGAMHFFTTPDWKPIPHLIRAGYQCHTAFRILLAVGLTGDTPALKRRACLLMDNALRNVRDFEHDGFFYAAPGAIPNHLHAQDLRVKHKAWWVQMEALKALLAVSRADPDNEHYARYFEDQWMYVQHAFLDRKHGGVYSAGLDMLPRWRRALDARFAPPPITRKGDVWKDASHEGRALLYCVQTLRAAPD